MLVNQLIGIFGGTFDPFHKGHLKSVESLLNELDFSAIHLIPSATPPHRQPANASTEHRLNMLYLSVTGRPKLIVNELECQRQGRSFTIDTLKKFRLDYPGSALAFIIGMDAFITIQQWKNWDQYLDYAHLLIMPRPGYQKPPLTWFKEKQVIDPKYLNQYRSGKVYFANSRLVDISSTQIRKLIRAGGDLTPYLSQSVINYIFEYKLYAS